MMAYFRGERLGQEAGIEAPKLRSELEDGGHPSLFCLVVHPDAHVAAKRGHFEDPREDTLVVSIDKASNASKTCNRKDLDIPGAILCGR